MDKMLLNKEGEMFIRVINFCYYFKFYSFLKYIIIQIKIYFLRIKQNNNFIIYKYPLFTRLFCFFNLDNIFYFLI